MKAHSLAECCNKIKVWSLVGVQLIDTKFGDIYRVSKEANRATI